MTRRSTVLAMLFVLMLPLGAAASPLSVSIVAGQIGDAFQITLTGDGTFEAFTSGTNPDGTPVDTKLFLFDANYFGLAANDDVAPGNPNSLLWYHQGPGTSTYNLIVTMWNASPEDASGVLIFPDADTCATQPVCGPSAGEESTIFTGNWSNLGGLDGQGVNANFQLGMTFNGADVAGSASPEGLPTPEPASVLLFGTGIAGLARRYRRQRNAA